MRSLWQLVFVTGYFMAVALVTFAMITAIAGSFFDAGGDLAAAVVLVTTVGCIGATGYLGMRLFNRLHGVLW